jgi:hypothetical protein
MTSERIQSDPGVLSAGGPARSSVLGTARWHIAALLVALLPALGAAFAAYSVLGYFDAMSRYQGSRGHGGVGSVAFGLYQANRPLPVVALAGAILAGFLAIGPALIGLRS